MSTEFLDRILASEAKLTPMMEQYISIKKNYPDTLLLFRMGDFYEVFFDDAIRASQILNITLTHRGKIGDHPIPMAGIPHHAANAYIDRITARGLKAAICEQITDPKESKGIVERKVVQVVGPGIPYDLDKAPGNEGHFIATAFHYDKKYFLILLDFTTGLFQGLVCQSETELLNHMLSYSPKEFIHYVDQWSEHKEFQSYIDSQGGLLKTCLPREHFDSKNTLLYTAKMIPGHERDATLKLVPGLLHPIGAVAFYICSTQSLEKLVHIRPFRLESDADHLRVTLPTLRGLEIFPRDRETYKDSLLGFMDKTQTATGCRNLRELFLRPLLSPEKLNNRFRLIDFFLKNPEAHEEIRRRLSEVRDLERILAKVTQKKVTASDLLNLARSIESYSGMRSSFTNMPLEWLPFLDDKTQLDLEKLSQEILAAINDEIGATLDKGNLIREGLFPERDRLAKLSVGQEEGLSELEASYRASTQINNLKIKYNNINGFFIEISKAHTSKVPAHFERRQTLVSSERYVTEELKNYEKEVLTARYRLEKLEREIFQSFVQKIEENSLGIFAFSKLLSEIDIFQSFAWVAMQEGFVQPEFSPKKKILEIEGSWHPLIKGNLKDEFVCHDLKLDHKTFFALITGPNMAGKTTVMREMAIIQFLAQIGSYVPAKRAKLGLCDYLFSRLGASDDILRNQSTFMVEMSETAEILRHASERSLIILDEVGRGTSTYDGLSIAWALVEHIVRQIGCITFFSTHYHELIEVIEKLEGAQNYTVKTSFQDGKVKFLYTLIPEACPQSYGIHVARMAGLPKGLLKRSEEILKELELTHHGDKKDPKTKKNKHGCNGHNGVQLSIFPDPEAEAAYQEKLKGLHKTIQDLNITKMTPLDALNKLHDLKENLRTLQ